MAADAARVRDGRPTILTSVRTAPAVTEIAGWVRDEVARHALVAHRG
jgi:urease accessory protein